MTTLAQAHRIVQAARDKELYAMLAHFRTLIPTEYECELFTTYCPIFKSDRRFMLIKDNKNTHESADPESFLSFLQHKFNKPIKP